MEIWFYVKQIYTADWFMFYDKKVHHQEYDK